MLATGLFALLKNDPGLSALIGGRIFPVLLPENVTLPAMTYQVVGGSSSPTFQTSGMQKVRVQFDCFADKSSGGYLAAATLRDTLRALLNGFQGELVDGTLVQNVDLIQGTDYFEQYARQFRCMAEFYFYFTFAS